MNEESFGAKTIQSPMYARSTFVTPLKPWTMSSIRRPMTPSSLVWYMRISPPHHDATASMFSSVTWTARADHVLRKTSTVSISLICAPLAEFQQYEESLLLGQCCVELQQFPRGERVVRVAVEELEHRPVDPGCVLIERSIEALVDLLEEIPQGRELYRSPVLFFAHVAPVLSARARRYLRRSV